MFVTISAISQITLEKGDLQEEKILAARWGQNSVQTTSSSICLEEVFQLRVPDLHFAWSWLFHALRGFSNQYFNTA